jgi:hypothetical protein
VVRLLRLALLPVLLATARLPRGPQQAAALPGWVRQEQAGAGPVLQQAVAQTGQAVDLLAAARRVAVLQAAARTGPVVGPLGPVAGPVAVQGLPVPPGALVALLGPRRGLLCLPVGLPWVRCPARP